MFNFFIPSTRDFIHVAHAGNRQRTFCGLTTVTLSQTTRASFDRAKAVNRVCQQCERAMIAAAAAEATKIVTGHPDTVVRVRLMGDDVTRKVWIEVSVQSHMKPGLWANKNVDADAANLDYEVEKAAELLAMHQAASYGDPHNPASVAKAALAALRDLQSTAAKAQAVSE